MNKRNRTIVYLLLCILPLAGILFHYLYLRNAIVSAYEGNPDHFIKFILDALYPRFYIEKDRFDINFFLSKADQVIYRFATIYYFIFLLIYLYQTNNFLKIKIEKLFYTETTSRNIDVLRILFFSYCLYLSYEMLDELIAKQSLKLFYKPIYLLSFFHIPFPSYSVILIIGALWYFLNGLIILNIRPILNSCLSLVIFILIQCWLFSFEKLEHGYATFTYAFMLLPFLFEEKLKNHSSFGSWSLQLIKITIAMVYFLSGLEKILISQLSWVKPDTLKTYLSFHETDLSKIVIQSDLLCSLLSVGALLLQLSFIFILFLPRYKWIWIIGGVLFHTGTLVLMNIGILLNPWILVYIFYIDWTKVYDFFCYNFKKLNLRSS